MASRIGGGGGGGGGGRVASSPSMGRHNTLSTYSSLGVTLRTSSIGTSEARGRKTSLKELPPCEQIFTYNHNETTYSGPFRRSKLATVTIPSELKYRRKEITRYGYLGIHAFRGSVQSNPDSALREEEIQAVLNFLDVDGDGELSQEEIMLAVRRYKRMDSKTMQDGKKMMQRLMDWLWREKMSIEEWFDRMDSTSVRQGDDRSDGKITSRELMKGMLQLFKDEPDETNLRFEKEDVDKLQRFLDPNADGDVVLEEVLYAVEKLEQTNQEMAVAAVLQKLNTHLKGTRMNLFDFFKSLDTSGDGIVDRDELRVGLQSVTVSQNKKADRKNVAREFRERWHEYFVTVNDDKAELLIYPLVNRCVTGNTGKTSFELHVRLVPERILDMRNITVTIVPERMFRSKRVVKLDWPESSMFCCAKDLNDMAWWMRALTRTCRFQHLPRPVCAFGGKWCTGPFTRCPDEPFMPTPYANTSRIACLKCFFDNDTNRWRESHAHMQFPAHRVAHGHCCSVRAEHWRTLPAPTIEPNPIRADCLLHVDKPFSRPPEFPTNLPPVRRNFLV